METNSFILEFLKNNYILLFIVFFILIRIVPPEWAGFWKYKNDKEEDGRAPKISLLKLFFHNIIEALWGTIIVNLIALLRDTIISFIIFGSLGFDIFYRHSISRESITLVCIGVIIMYLELLIKTGRHLRLFGGLLEWERQSSVDINPIIPPQVIKPLKKKA